MKKIFLALAATATMSVTAGAQSVLGYSPQETQSPLVNLTDAVVIYSASADGTLENLQKTFFTPDGTVTTATEVQGFPIGFDFPLGDNTYNTFIVNGAGYISLGNGDDLIETQPNAGANFLTYGQGLTSIGAVPNAGASSTSATVINYGLNGEGNEKELVITYSSVGALASMFGSTPTPLSMQLRLKANGDVEINFDGLDAVESSINYRIGLRDNSNYMAVTGSKGAIEKQINSSGFFVVDNSMAAGYELLLKMPAKCQAPSTAPSDLKLDLATSVISGSFTPSATADNYLVLYAVDNLKATPSDGHTYAAGDSIGNAAVAYFGPKTEFTVTGLEPGTNYVFGVYAANAYGVAGPAYNTDGLMQKVTTCPAPPLYAVFTATTATSLTLHVTGNAAGDDVVVLYTPYVVRDNFGDHGLYGPLTPDLTAGTVLPLPDDYTPDIFTPDSLKADNGGIVAYVGKSIDALVIDNLKPSTGYYVQVLSRDSSGAYSHEPTSYNLKGVIDTGSSTDICLPYNGESINFPRYTMPWGWSTADSETVANSVAFQDQTFGNVRTGEITQGTQYIQQRAQVSRGNATDGVITWLELPTIDVSGRHYIVNFDYCMTAAESRFATDPYNEWAENDRLAIEVSVDSGATWTSLNAYDATVHPTQEETLSYVSISADLNDYRGQKVKVRLYWHTYSVAAFGTNLYVDRVTLTEGEFPEVPEVTVSDVTFNSAKVNWVSSQTSYEVAFFAVNDPENITTVTVSDVMSYTIEGLDPLTEYAVKVRGIIDGDNYSEWSDLTHFTTADWPEVAAPTDLSADTETGKEDGKVILSWASTDDMLSYEVAYRLASATSWEYVSCDESTVTLDNLIAGERYIWKVRALCTHNRETAFSANSQFTMPVYSSIGTVGADNVTVTTSAGTITISGAEGEPALIATTGGSVVTSVASLPATATFTLPASTYIVTIGSKAMKVIVR